MIGKLKGLVDSVGEDSLILDVNGVGYLVAASARTLRNLPALEQAVALHIETQVREDAIRLYGFLAEAERDWFRLLQGVQGVGAKVALSILGILSSAELANAIALQDKAMVARAPGVGPKLATRIVVELKDKAPTSGGADLRGVTAADGPGDDALGRGARDAVLALVNLGYPRPQAALAVARGVASLGAGAETAALVRRGLKELAQ
jgi:Holliday junction DNA helicase RuvA